MPAHEVPLAWEAGLEMKCKRDLSLSPFHFSFSPYPPPVSLPPPPHFGFATHTKYHGEENLIIYPCENYLSLTGLTVHFNVGSFHPYQPLCNAIVKDIIQLLLLLLLLDYYYHYLYHF